MSMEDLLSGVRRQAQDIDWSDAIPNELKALLPQPMQGPEPDPASQPSITEETMRIFGALLNPASSVVKAGRELGGAMAPYIPGAVRSVNEMSRSALGRNLIPDMAPRAEPIEDPGAPFPSESEARTEQASANEAALMELMRGMKGESYAARGDSVSGLKGGGNFSKASEGTAARKMRNLGVREDVDIDPSSLGMSEAQAKLLQALANSSDPRERAAALQAISGAEQKRREMSEEQKAILEFLNEYAIKSSAGLSEGDAFKLIMGDENASPQARVQAYQLLRELINRK